MRYLIGIIISISLILITALIFAQQEWLIEPGASFTLDKEDVSKIVQVVSAGVDEENATLHCKTEGAIRLLEEQYRNYKCKPCSNGKIPIQTFQINYPSEASITDIKEHKIGGITVYIAQCDITSVRGTLSCAACSETNK